MFDYNDFIVRFRGNDQEREVNPRSRQKRRAATNVSMSRPQSGAPRAGAGPSRRTQALGPWSYSPPPKRPGFGREGKPIDLYANHFKASVSIEEVTLVRSLFTPTVSSCDDYTFKQTDFS